MSTKSSDNNLLYDQQLKPGQRIHLALSEEAEATIESDMVIFQGGDNKNGFINRIIEHYNQNARASISYELERQRDRLTAWLLDGSKSKSLSPTEESVVDRLLIGYKAELLEEVKSYPKGHNTSYKPRINNRVYEMLNMGSIDYFQETGNYTSESKHIKAILEEYARLPFAAREQIYYKNIIDRLNYAITQGRTVLINYSGKEWLLQPYRIIQKLEYNYLIALKPESGYRSHYDVARISRIGDAPQLKAKIHISQETKAAIDSAFEKNGIYPYSDSNKITVKLSPQGIRMYNNILHLRPNKQRSLPTGDSVIMEFECSPEQIYNYFFKFGKEAVILSPEELKNRFRTNYQEATQEYNL